jgi:hypothetical protein
MENSTSNERHISARIYNGFVIVNNQENIQYLSDNGYGTVSFMNKFN